MNTQMAIAFYCYIAPCTESSTFRQCSNMSLLLFQLLSDITCYHINRWKVQGIFYFHQRCRHQVCHMKIKRTHSRLFSNFPSCYNCLLAYYYNYAGPPLVVHRIWNLERCVIHSLTLVSCNGLVVGMICENELLD